MEDPPIIAIVGSLNVDLTFQVPHLPQPGETLTARIARTAFGGKGANQAVAAARAGGDVSLLGCLGNDDHGRTYRSYLNDLGVNTRCVLTAKDRPTGTAFITVDDRGENTIVVNPGANYGLTPGHISRELVEAEFLDAVLLQLECPLPVVKAAASWAREHGAKVILNPSPWTDEFLSAKIPVDVLIVNETEAAAFTGEPPEIMIITRGAASTQVMNRSELLFERTPPKVRPVDTVGAGDTFAGAFTVAYAAGEALEEAVAFANAAAALATLKPGAQEAIPTREQIQTFRERGSLR